MKTTVDDLPNFEKRISTAVEYCVSPGCGAVISSDGCSNPDCWKHRPLYPLQEAMRTLALNKQYDTNNHTGARTEIYRTQRERPYLVGWFTGRCRELFSGRVPQTVLADGQGQEGRPA